MKKCPYCHEEIQDAAIKCHYCNEWLDKKEEITLNKDVFNDNNLTPSGFSSQQNTSTKAPKEKPKMTTENLYEAILGEKNCGYYLAKFYEFDQKGPGLKASWNWAAFFFPVWALYRKMYGWFFVLFCSLFLFKILKKELNSWLPSIVFIVMWIAFTAYANAFYHNNIKKKIAAAQFTLKDETRLLEYLCQKGGVNTWVIYVSAAQIIFGIVFAIVFPFFKVPESMSFALLLTSVITGLIIWISYDVLNREKRNNSGGDHPDGKKPDESQDAYMERVIREAEEQAAAEARKKVSYPTSGITQQNEEFIALLKSTIKENRFDIIPDSDLIEICKRARSIDDSSSNLDAELSNAIDTLLEEIKKRGLSEENKQEEIHDYDESSFTKAIKAVGNYKWVPLVLSIVIVFILIIIVAKSFSYKGKVGHNKVAVPVNQSSDMKPVTVLTTVQNSDGLTEADLDQTFLSNLEDWNVKTTLEKSRAKFIKMGYDSNVFNPKISANSVYVVANGKKLAIIKINYDNQVREVAIMGIKGNEVYRVGCFRESNNDIPVWSGECGKKIQEVFGVQIP